MERIEWVRRRLVTRLDVDQDVVAMTVSLSSALDNEIQKGENLFIFNDLAITSLSFCSKSRQFQSVLSSNGQKLRKNCQF